MADTSADDSVARVFEDQRGRLEAVAYRMLGSRADAEDAVQEAWLRLSRQDEREIDNLAGWLTTVVGRVCLDMLRARKARPETSFDEQLPDLIVTQDDDTTPEEDALEAESVGLALLVVLDALRPAQRLAFVLHDMFAVPFEEIASITGRSPDAAKMLASRARRKVQGTPRPADDPLQQRAVVDAFIAATRSGDFAALLQVLDPEVTWRSHTARGLVVKLGATEVATKLQHGGRPKVTVRRVLVNGEPGVMVWSPKGKPVSVMACTVVDGRIVEVLSVLDPARLAAMDLPPAPTGAER